MLISIAKQINMPETKMNAVIALTPSGNGLFSMHQPQPAMSNPNSESSKMQRAMGVSSDATRLKSGDGMGRPDKCGNRVPRRKR